MDQLERDLRQVLADDRLVLPVPPAALDRVHAGMRLRRRRNRAVAASLSTLALVGVGVGIAVVAGPARQGNTRPPADHLATKPAPVPWLPLPATPAPSGPPRTPSERPAATAPMCRARQLSVAGAGSDGAGGHLETVFRLTNTGDTACQLAGAPTVVAKASGAPDVTADHAMFFPQPGRGGVVAPGHAALLAIETDTSCPARPGGGVPAGAPVYRTLTVSAPGGGTLTAHGLRLDVGCGLHAGRFLVRTPDVPTPAATPRSYPWQHLTATLHLPAVATAGGELAYTVTLANPTGRAVALRPCPAYRESMGGSERAYELNCAAVSDATIGAHRSVTFAMRIRIPAGARGQVGLAWFLGWPERAVPGPGAKATLTVGGGGSGG